MFQEVPPHSNKTKYNDSEFKEVVKVFHQIVTEINKSYKKQSKRKKSHQIVKKPQDAKTTYKQFNRNSFHIQLAIKLYHDLRKENKQYDNQDPTYQSRKILKNNKIDTELSNNCE